MAITLNLAPEQEVQLRERARQQGREAENYAIDLILRDINGSSAKETEGLFLADDFESLIGVLDSSARNGGKVSHVAENTGEEFSKIIAEKHKAGHL